MAKQVFTILAMPDRNSETDNFERLPHPLEAGVTTDWKPEAIETARIIGQEMGISIVEGHRIQGDSGILEPTILINTHRPDLIREFWDELESRIPNYWDRNQE